MAKWSKVTKGDSVELRGRTFEVVKIKAKGAHAKVTVKGGGSVFESKVLLDDKVAIVTKPLRDRDGAMQRWAKPSEVKHGLKAGDSKVTTPPAKQSADPWNVPRDKVEHRLDKYLSAHLVGEAADERVGYYVPPVDVSTVAGHLAIFHGVDTGGLIPLGMLKAHAEEHELAREGGKSLTVNHWHRPRP